VEHCLPQLLDLYGSRTPGLRGLAVQCPEACAILRCARTHVHTAHLQGTTFQAHINESILTFDRMRAYAWCADVVRERRLQRPMLCSTILVGAPGIKHKAVENVASDMMEFCNLVGHCCCNGVSQRLEDETSFNN
jgi:hypothetical protein